MNKQYLFLAGMPRSGSTLLTSILNQNPDVFASSSSPVCNTLYWSHQLWREQIALQANPNPTAVQAVLSSIIPSFYSTRPEPIIIDKAFSWGTPDNLSVLINALGYTPKFIVMDRPINEVLNSYHKLIQNSPQFVGRISDFMDLGVMAHQNLLAQIPEQCFVVSYDRLCNDTANLLKEFYDFIEQPNFQHDLSHIVNTCTDNDKVWGLTDMHKVRPTIGVV
jgi:sulfotransferase